MWLLATDSKAAPPAILPSTYQPLDVAVTDDGDVIAAAGNVSDPHLLIIRRGTQELPRYPPFPTSIFPDGKQLAFPARRQAET